jgi:CRISPR-associated endonuclease/helicase Cas3
LIGYYQKAQALAQKRLDEIGWTKREALMADEKPLEQAFNYLMRNSGKPFVARNLQVEVKKLLKQTQQPTLLLIEAAMGEGKTEAAFYAHLRLQAQLEHRGLYVALPTMATGNAMFTRTATFVNEHAAGRTLPVDIQLLHGATPLNELYQTLQEKLRPNSDADDDKLENIAAQEFFTHKKRALLSEYGVGTIDQALLSVLNIKHQFVRLWGLGNRVVVIDEVHAYDTYTSGLIVTLVRWLHALGSSVILMSATLPKNKRNEILEAYGGETKETEAYPRIFKVSGGVTTLQIFEGDSKRKQTIKLEPTTSDISTLTTLIQEQLKHGGCAVCIVNTVDRAQSLYEKLHDIEKYLFHARFPANDRAEIENKVIAKFGKEATLENGKRPAKAVLIATQVVEQSLDLDFDVMLSDLAPVDLLLQRAGRLWRHERTKRPVTTPKLFVTGLLHEGELPDLHTHYWDRVYNPFILYKSWEQLKDCTTITLPDDIDPLVQRVYDGAELSLELSESAKTQIKNDLEAFKQIQLIDLKDSENAVISRVGSKGDLQLRDALETREEDDAPNGKPIALTRKGDASTLVIPLFKLGQSYFLDAAGKRPYDEKKPLELFLRSVRSSRLSVVGCSQPKKFIPSALEKHNKQEGIDKTFAAWRDHALLRSCVPLILNEEGLLRLNKAIVELHPELGIRYYAE